MSETPRKPNTPSVRTFAAAEKVNGDRPPIPLKGMTRRPPEVLETIIEDTAARLAALSNSFDTLAGETATKEQADAIAGQCRRTHKLLEDHLAEHRKDRVLVDTRHGAVMSLLGEILARLPVPVVPATRQPTMPSPAQSEVSEAAGNQPGPESGDLIPGFDPKHQSSLPPLPLPAKSPNELASTIASSGPAPKAPEDPKPQS